ncbi:TolB family protein [Streptomyces sp. NPDC055078]
MRLGTTAAAVATALASVCAAALLVPTGAHAQDAPPRRPFTERVTQGADQRSDEVALSSDGRFAVFTSRATNLVPGDTNGFDDIFVRDVRSGRTERVNVTADGTQGDGHSKRAAISADGRYVAFATDAANLGVPGLKQSRGIYLKDRRSGALTYVGRDLGDGFVQAYAPTVSADGRFVAFHVYESASRPARKTAIRDMRTGELRILGSRQAGEPSISADGGKLVYTDLSAAPIQYPPSSAHLWDRSTGESRRLDAAPDGTPGNGKSYEAEITPDGRYAVFHSSATNLVPAADPNGAGFNVFVRDLRKGTIRRIDGPAPGQQTTLGSLSGDGRQLVFSAGTDASRGWYLRDLRTGRTRLAIPDVTGAPGLARVLPRALDRHARVLAFLSWSPDIAPGPSAAPGTDVYLRHFR